MTAVGLSVTPAGLVANAPALNRLLAYPVAAEVTPNLSALLGYLPRRSDVALVSHNLTQLPAMLADNGLPAQVLPDFLPPG